MQHSEFPSHLRLAVVLLCLSTASLTAQETAGSRPQEDDSIVITATRHEQRLRDLPYIADVVGQQGLDQARTIQDALAETSGVHLQRTSYGQISPFLRGLTGYHTLMLIDGIRLNNSVMRSGPNEYWGLVDNLSLDRLEVVLGPGSVLYGSDAIGGSVNAIPLRRQHYGPENSWDRRLALRYSSAEGSLGGRAEISGNVGEEFGFVIGGGIGAFSDLDAGGDLGRQPGTSYQNAFGDAHLDLVLDDHWNVGLLTQVARVSDVNRVHRTVDGISFHGTTIGSDQSRVFDWERDLVAVFLDGTDLDGFVNEVRVTLSYQRLEELQDRTRGDATVNLSGFDVSTLGIGVHLTSETRIGRITWGADYYHDEVDSFRRDFDAMGMLTSVRIQGQVGDDADHDLLGIYIQDEIRLSHDVELILGGRFSRAAASANKVEDPMTGGQISLEDDWNALVGSARVLWRSSESMNLYGGISQGFRSPNLSDLSRFDSARSGELEVPSPGLDPERFIDFETGVKIKTGGLLCEAAVHYTIIDDLIINQPTGAMIGGETVVTKRNGGDGHTLGFEARAEYRFDDHWSTFGSFQWMDGQIETYPTSAPILATESLSRLTPISGTIGVGWQTEDGRLQVRAWALLVDNQDRLNTRDRADTSRIPPGGTPGHVTFNLGARYAVTDRASIHLAVENILNKNYRTHGSGLQEPGVNLVLGFDLSF